MAVDREVAERLEFAGMIGRSAPMQEVFDLIRRLAPHVRTALICGETGTGKELVARALHQCGPRKAKRFVAVNCSAVVETLFESELFGHVRGAFTGATDNKAGLFETADGGTLFLDEIGELPLALQAKLLRVLESGEVQRVGSLQPVHTDVRVICASNRDLGVEVAAGRFRSDLLYRLNVVQITLPLASRAPRRYSVPHGRLPSGIRPAVRETHLRPRVASRAPAERGAMARQHPAAAQRARTRVHARR